jgi:hypothetical protein
MALLETTCTEVSLNGSQSKSQSHFVGIHITLSSAPCLKDDKWEMIYELPGNDLHRYKLNLIEILLNKNDQPHQRLFE